jgi:hypothetical protein
VADTTSKAAANIDDDPFSAPGTSEFVDWKDINGELLVIEVEEFVKGVPTVHGDNDAIRADLHVLTGELAGETYEGTLIFGRSMIPQLRKREGEMVLARLGQGAKQKGKNAPWQLIKDISPEDKALGLKWYKSRKAADPFSEADDSDE